MHWDLLQQLQLGEARDRAASMEERVANLERKIERNDRVLVELIKYLEERDNRDLERAKSRRARITAF